MSLHLGIDLGAESGRVVAGTVKDLKIELQELHRFKTGGTSIENSLRWDVDRFWQEILKGLSAAEALGTIPDSVGVDTWGVDYVLLANQTRVEMPWHYRDKRTVGVIDQVFNQIDKHKIYRRTGIQFLPFNTLFQLYAARESKAIQDADCLLTIPDYFHWLLSGRCVAEFTNATTTQCMDPVNRTWDFDLLNQLNLPGSILPEVVQPGTVLGNLQPHDLIPDTFADTKVIAPASHDTGSAVCSTPVSGNQKNWAYISSGTWSLVGIESETPIIHERSLAMNITNEGGVEGTWRVLKNVMGLWMVQGLRRSFLRKNQDYDYAELTRLASSADEFTCLVDPDDERFLNPPDMLDAIIQYCYETNQPVPQDAGAAVRCVLESLALKYDSVLRSLMEISNRDIEVVHVFGGGCQNELLNQFVADACDVEVVAGPVEATIIGNILMQCRALERFESLSQLRQVVINSFELKKYRPIEEDKWSLQRHRFVSLLAKTP